MACAHPFQIKNTKFNSHSGRWYACKEYIQVPCGKCLNCRIDRRNTLEDECNYEYSKFGYGCFLTLTYDDPHILSLLRKDKNGNTVATLQRSDYRNFIKLLRRNIDYYKLSNNTTCNKNFKYLVVGEYGGNGQKFDRPHFHILLFGLDFKVCRKLFSNTWKGGFTDARPILKGGIRYVLKYCDKQQSNQEAEKLYDDNNIERPFCFHSIGLGSGLWKDNLNFIKNNNYCYQTKHKKLRPIPIYWRNKLLGHTMPDLNLQRQQLISYCIKPDKKDSSGSTYSLMQLNEFRHRQALKREENLKIQMRNDCTPVPITYVPQINWHDMQLINKAMDFAQYGDEVPF